MAAALVRLTSSRARGNLNVTSCLQRRPLVAVQKGRQAAVSMSSQSLRGFLLKEVVHFGGLLGLSGMHHFPSKFSEYLQTPVGRLSNFEAHWLTPLPHPRRPSVRAARWATHWTSLEERYISRALEQPQDSISGESDFVMALV